MYTCVAYDISSNRVRLLAAKWCKRIGLVRLQRSVFTGKVPAADIAEMEQELRSMLAKTDKLVILPLDKATYCVLLRQSDNERLKQLQDAFTIYDL